MAKYQFDKRFLPLHCYLYIHIYYILLGAIDVTEDLKAAAKAPGTKKPKAETIGLKEPPQDVVNIGHSQPSIDGGRINIMLCYAEVDVDKMGPPTEVKRVFMANTHPWLELLPSLMSVALRENLIICDVLCFLPTRRLTIQWRRKGRLAYRSAHTSV